MEDDAFHGVCVHEAAHAVAATVLLRREPGVAAQLERAVARRELGNVEDAQGNTVTGVYGAVLGGRFYEPGSCPEEPGADREGRARHAFFEAVKAFADPVAELSIGEPQAPLTVDDVLLADHGGERDLAHAYDVLWHSDQLTRAQEARSVACRFVRDNCSAIAAVADLLYRHGEVQGEEIEGLSLGYRSVQVP